MPNTTFDAICPESTALAVAKLLKEKNNNYLLLVENIQQAQTIFQELKYFLQIFNIELAGQQAIKPFDCLLFEDREILIYDSVSPPKELISQRLKTLTKWQNCENTILIVAINTALHRLPPKSFINNQQFILKTGEIVSLTKLTEQLVESGYSRVDEVNEPSEFALRGGLIDVFPMGSQFPIRVDFFDDEVEKIRYFDIDNQRSTKTIEAIEILASNEFLLDSNTAKQFSNHFLSLFPSHHYNPLLKAIQIGEPTPGIEYFLPLLHSNPLTSLIDYSPQNTVCIIAHRVKKSAKNYLAECKKAFEEHKKSNQAVMPVKDLLLTFDELISDSQTVIELSETVNAKITANLLANNFLKKLPKLNISPDNPTLQKLDLLIANAQKNNLQCLLFLTSTSRLEQLQLYLNDKNLSFCLVEKNQSIKRYSESILLINQYLQNGFIDVKDKQMLLSESDIFTVSLPQLQTTTIAKKQNRNFQQNLDLAQLKNGDLVVHIEYGIGIFRGLETLTVGEWRQDTIAIEYNGDSSLFIPIEKMHYIERYIGDSEHIKIDRLGASSWKKRKEQAKKKIKDVAAELLSIYSNREIHTRKAILPPEDYQQFIEQFPYIETPDQEKVTTEILSDLAKKKPADRLICGDVGFGKTEIALRAAFIMVSQNKQVVVLVPTTILANQHFQTFCDRFAGWAVKINVVSRLRSNQQNKDILKQAKNGKIDILIGTHRLLQNDVELFNLGLVIIDEEHRFGVRQKEIFKKMRAQVDIISMTATPIPRTLNLAFSKMRDISILGTPPAGRIGVLTFVNEWSETLAKEAILRELNRGGQVYFVHNNIASIDRRREELLELIPNAAIAIAHGQMPEHEMEKVMEAFYLGKEQILLCTTIIETGLDVPNANTILIDRADKFGLAQLHQLRGRVGRSSHQAYAYLFSQADSLLQNNARRRLNAIAQSQQLGGGFKLALEDLEIRGAGEILGDQQKGHIQKIGLNLYMEMLNQTVNDITQQNNLLLWQQKLKKCEIELAVETLFPEEYLFDVATRLSLYQRLNLSDFKQCEDLQMEVIDRFGRLPQSAINLFEVHKIKLYCVEKGIISVNKKSNKIKITLNKENSISIDKLLTQLQQNQENWQLIDEHSFRIKEDLFYTDNNISYQLFQQTLQSIVD